MLVGVATDGEQEDVVVNVTSVVIHDRRWIGDEIQWESLHLFLQTHKDTCRSQS